MNSKNVGTLSVKTSDGVILLNPIGYDSTSGYKQMSLNISNANANTEVSMKDSY